MSKRADHTYFRNHNCKYFPCHTTSGEYFNCLFCYCPLYAMGKDCGGGFTYTAQGAKDCSGCLIPHAEGGYEYVMARLGGSKEGRR